MRLDSYSSCQLTSMPSEKLDLSMDFQSDLDYDFFEKNVNASPSCRYMEFTSPYGQRRQWGFPGGDQDLSLWQDLNSLWNQQNDVAYGDDRASFYDGREVYAKPVVSENDAQSLSIRQHNPYNTNAQFFHKKGGLKPTFSTAGRQPASPNGQCCLYNVYFINSPGPLPFLFYHNFVF